MFVVRAKKNTFEGKLEKNVFLLFLATTAIPLFPTLGGKWFFRALPIN